MAMKDSGCRLTPATIALLAVGALIGFPFLLFFAALIFGFHA
jgi:hypothetical protein